VGLNESLNYYLDSSAARPGFVNVSGINGLIDEVGVKFDGSVNAQIDAAIALIGTTLTCTVGVSDLDALFRGDTTALFLSYSVTTPEFEIPSFLDILLMDPQGIVDALDGIFLTIEDASLGPHGIVTNLPIPFIRNGLGSALGAGTDDNVIGRGRRKIVPLLQSGLNSFEGDKDTVADVIARLMETAIDRIGILQENETVTVTCFYYNDDPNVTQREVIDDCLSDYPVSASLMWTLPFGQSFAIELPLDFDLDAGSFPLEIEFDGIDSNVPTLAIGWSFNLAFGFDEVEGFFLYTFPEGSQEFRVEALLSVLDRTLSATLIFLKASISDLDLRVGAAVYVDLDKVRALRLESDKTTDPQYGRLTRGNLKQITKISDLFSIGALAGATVSVSDVNFAVNTDFFPESLKSIGEWVPELGADLYAHARKQTGPVFTTAAARRQLFAEDYHPFVRPGSLTEHTGHRAHPLLRSLAGSDDLLDNNFSFDKCPVNLTAGETFCLKVDNIALNLGKLADLISPILENFVSAEGSGYLDKVMDPVVLFLDEPTPGISSVMGKVITVLDIAEAYYGEKCGAPTVRALIRIYKALSLLAQSFRDNGDLLLADSCNALTGRCTGGAFSSLSSTRRLHERVLSIFHHEDTAGLPLTALDVMEEERNLGTCSNVFSPPDCLGVCTCDGVAGVLCTIKQLACRAGSVPGLSFPFLSDLMGLVGLLFGNDIVSFSTRKPVFHLDIFGPHSSLFLSAGSCSIRAAGFSFCIPVDNSHPLIRTSSCRVKYRFRVYRHGQIGLQPGYQGDPRGC
jgi:hypothetical protein